MTTNGSGKPTPSTNGTKSSNRADETEELLAAVQALIKPFIQSADTDTPQKVHGIDPRPNGSKPPLSNSLHPQNLKQLLPTSLPQTGVGKDGLLSVIQTILSTSTNTWDTGFLDKLYSTPTPIGLAADLLLSTLNTNLHVYQVSPALTLIEKLTARSLATLFGFVGPYAGGVSQPGGSAANATSMVTARNLLFPETKTEGNGGRRFVLFTSEHGHYSVEKAAQMFGFGSRAVKSVAVDAVGRMDPQSLSSAIATSRQAGETPFYVNATAGTTVLGSFDPLNAIADVCQQEGLWLHVDGSWGGSVIFSETQRHKLQGSSRADSISICAHKMLQVPLTCSFLLVSDMRRLHQGMTLPAGYLFHSADPPEEMTTGHHRSSHKEEEKWDGISGSLDTFYDLADLTPQCGRRGDSLKLALTWLYHGSSGFERAIDHAFSIAAYLTSLVAANPKFSLVSSDPPACLQVCFYHAKTSDSKRNSAVTEGITRILREEGGFMTDFAPGEEGKFFRVVVNGGTDRGTVEGLVRGIERAGERMGL